MFARLKKIAAATVGAALLVGGGAVAAQAQPASIVDKDLTGNIHLVKYDDSAGLSAPQGIETKVGAKPVDGIKFTLKKIVKKDGSDIDLNKGDQRKALGSLTAADLVAGKNKDFKVGDIFGKEETTKDGGKIDWTGVPVGVYLLEETNSKAADGKVYKAAAPSILFIPTTDPTDPSKWIMDGDKYGLWVYPKNSLENNEKKVVDADTSVGDKITYTVTASIPAVQKVKDKEGKEHHNLTDFWFQDQLDPKLELAEGDVEVKVGDTTLVAGTDYKHKVFPAKDGKGQTLEVYVTAEGREKIAAAKLANAETVVTLTFEPTVKESGIIANEAYVYKNAGEGGGKTNPPGDTPGNPDGSEKTNVTVTAYGKLKVVKTDDNDKPLEGAEFQIFRKGALDKPIKVNGKDKFVTNDKGIVEIDGIHVTDYVDDAKPGDTVPGYVLVETKAPAGYELIPSPIDFDLKIGKVEKIKVKLDAEGKEIAKSAEEISSPAVNNEATETVLTADATVINFEALPKLPLTGGTGVALFGILGALVIAGGVYASRKKA